MIAANAATPSGISFFMTISWSVERERPNGTPRAAAERLLNEPRGGRLRACRPASAVADSSPGGSMGHAWPMLKAPTSAIAALLLVALTACGSAGSDDDKDGKNGKVTLSAEEKTAVANLQKAFTASTTGGLPAAEAKCVATEFVDRVGLAKLKSAGLLTSDDEVNTTGNAKFDADTSGKFADAFLGCVDYQQRLATETAKSDKTIDAAKLEDCLSEKLPDSLVKKMLVASQTRSSDSDRVAEEGNKAITDCKEASKK
jgi:hypothetical protein